MRRLKIQSGGQTGVDRAALDAAIELGLPCGGWCPKGRRSESGRIPGRYPLQETESPEYPVRTRKNIESSDATLILHAGHTDRGTRLTETICRKMQKPYIVINIKNPESIEQAGRWLREINIQSLNIAGPRESFAPGIYDTAKTWILRLLTGDSGQTNKQVSD
ncbi:MAG: putative molybdenum carrier protein [Bacteroidales bacterium]